VSFRIDKMLVLDIGRARHADGTKYETSTSIVRVLVVESFPAVLNWRVAVDYTADARSTVTCDAQVVDPRGRLLPAAHLKFVAEPGSDREEVPLPMFAATVRGTYSVRLYVNGATTPSATDDILVDVAASLA
jgi:hypothetical protein